MRAVAVSTMKEKAPTRKGLTLNQSTPAVGGPSTRTRTIASPSRWSGLASGVMARSHTIHAAVFGTLLSAAALAAAAVQRLPLDGTVLSGTVQFNTYDYYYITTDDTGERS
jgi:hypothetical protein